jgi:hypothetical protein
MITLLLFVIALYVAGVPWWLLLLLVLVFLLEVGSA